MTKIRKPRLGRARALALDVPRLLRIRHVLRNPEALLAGRFGRRTTLRFKSGLELAVGPTPPDVPWRLAWTLVALGDAGAEFADEHAPDFKWSVDPTRRTVTTPQGLHFTFESVSANVNTFTETFLQHIHYEVPDMRGLVVVDAGSFIGDAALYFANLGAEVYTYEPDPSNFSQLVENLRLNPCGGRVHAVPKAVGVDGEIPFLFGRGGNSQGYFDPAMANGSVESVSLETIVNSLPGDPFLLKADVKGAEFVLVRQPAIRRFTRLKIEYNGRCKGGGTADILLRQLRAYGFEGIAYTPDRPYAGLSEFGFLRMQRVG